MNAPPSMSASYGMNSAQNAPATNNYQHAHRMSRTEGVAKTGQPEVVGDISSWKAQQQQQQQQQVDDEQKYHHQQAYPDLNGLQAQTPPTVYSKSDGIPSTGSGGGGGLMQSRTSATGKQLG